MWVIYKTSQKFAAPKKAEIIHPLPKHNRNENAHENFPDLNKNIALEK